MTREIKFRAWRNDKQVMLQVGTIAFPTHKLNWYWGFTVDNDDLGHDFELMQYTGLKDKNGKEIYEGDIVRDFRFNLEAQTIGVVEMKNGMWWLEPTSAMGGNHYSPQAFEVIGNIYENPELLK